MWTPKSAAKMQAGVLVPDEVVDAMVEERLSRPDAAKDLFWTGIRERWRRPST